MADLKKQIEEDIKEYQSNFPYITHIAKDDWAFNYWVLDKLFHVDEELIEEKIVDYHDLGIDAYEIHEDTYDVYLIQNKYYSDSTPLNADYVKNDFLLRAINALKNGTYKKSEELQTFFTKHKDHPAFTVHLQLFITNNIPCKAADDYIKDYNLKNPNHRAKIFYLDDIEEKYYAESKQLVKNITVKIESVVKETILNINSEAYKLENVMDARYVFAPIVSVYRIYNDAEKQSYPIFDKNIREYLGNTGINKQIYSTLLDKNERKNFFYYNNGITIICDKMHEINTQNSDPNIPATFDIDNPQIVNGCQTVNSIYEALKNVNLSDLEKDFKDTFVMLKILEINRDDSSENALYEKIVKYNNSQNTIDEKTFIANTDIFIRLQTEFQKKGFLLLIKQSDKHKFSNEYKVITKLKESNNERVLRFGINPIKKASDVFIPLEKFLQVINAFTLGGHTAFTKKSSMLKFGSNEYKNSVEFIKNGTVTIDVLLDLYLLYMRAEQTKKASTDIRTLIPYYLIDAFAKFECSDRDPSLIRKNLKDIASINNLVKLYTAVSILYTVAYNKKHDIEYNIMIKKKVEYDMLESHRDTLEHVL